MKDLLAQLTAVAFWLLNALGRGAAGGRALWGLFSARTYSHWVVLGVAVGAFLLGWALGGRLGCDCPPKPAWMLEPTPAEIDPLERSVL